MTTENAYTEAEVFEPTELEMLQDRVRTAEDKLRRFMEDIQAMRLMCEDMLNHYAK